ncbi:hypothetical protein NUM3379_05030 [Kineococcus sp. NUM-3379]
MHERDEGFSLLEAVIAMVVTGILALGVAAVLVQSMDVSRTSADRTAAAAIATTQIETFRAQRGLDLQPGRTTVYVDPRDGAEHTTQDGTRYSVERDVSVVASSSEASLCTAASESVSYKRVRVVVDWPGRRSGQPVRADTVKSLGIGGVAAISVTGGNQQPVPGVRVTLAPLGASTTTGSDGCAVFTELSAAKLYTAGVDQPGYVGLDGTRAVSSGPFRIDPSKVTRLTFRYDRPGSLAVRPVPPPGPAPAALGVVPAVQVPAALQLTAGYNLWTAGSTRKYEPCPGTGGPCTTPGTSPTRVVPDLFPDSINAYRVWGGSCGTTQPVTPGAVPSALVTAGAAAGVDLPLGAVKVSVRKGTLAVPGASVVASPAPTALALGCLSNPQLTFTANAAGDAFIALPDGSWTVSANGGAQGAPFTVTAGVVNPAAVQAVAP